MTTNPPADRRDQRDRLEAVRGLPWTVIAPVALIVAVVGVALWLDVATGGDAEPPPLIGAIGTPVRGTFVPPTATPPGAAPTPRPTVTGNASGSTGTPEERDAERRQDLLVIVDGLLRFRDENGDFPTTNNNIQSLCVYTDFDAGCELADVLGADPPEDPLGEPGINGYWYQSDGATAKVYVSFEGDIDDAERCDTNYVDFEDKENLICPTVQ